jgi:hypothetical protein
MHALLLALSVSAGSYLFPQHELLADHKLAYRFVPALASLYARSVHGPDLGLSMHHLDSLSQAVLTPATSGQAGT